VAGTNVLVNEQDETITTRTSSSIGHQPKNTHHKTDVYKRWTVK